MERGQRPQPAAGPQPAGGRRLLQRDGRRLPGLHDARRRAARQHRRARLRPRDDAVPRERAEAWGVHNYEDVNHLRTTGTDALLAVTTGEIWLTEGAGLVRYFDGRRVTYPYDEARAADATRFMFDYVDAHTRPRHAPVLLRLAEPQRQRRQLRHRAPAPRRRPSARPTTSSPRGSPSSCRASRPRRSSRSPRRSLLLKKQPAPHAPRARRRADPLREGVRAALPRAHRGALERQAQVAFGKRSFSLRAAHNKAYLDPRRPGQPQAPAPHELQPPRDARHPPEQARRLRAVLSADEDRPPALTA